ncbi:hypothetical protein [Tsukamurella pseudospumae]|uniref:Mce-associated membrane protein n=1 Tax=Tsukamurella pseudospumae TaxID=239498 RepID=A0A137ZD85_9ACTN|nr:hypothetical protein [Tsukamurella pseudospumae]KXO96148.1 hypothetical protein AXK61_23525 [Tsukamurella pseudospumae]
MPQEHDDVRDEPDIETDEKRTVLTKGRRPCRAATADGKSIPAASRTDVPGPQGRRGPAGTVKTVLATVLVIALIVVSVLLVLQTRTLGSEREATADRARAEQIASDYAVKAATMDYRDLTPWLNGVKAGTTPELSKKFDAIVDLMREVLTPLRLTSTGKASFAKTTSEVNGIYQVKVAVDVSSQNVQAPQGTVTTSTYSVTLDRNRSWVITEAGDPANPSAVLSGIGGASPSSSAAPSASPSVPAAPAPSGTPN